MDQWIAGMTKVGLNTFFVVVGFVFNFVLRRGDSLSTTFETRLNLSLSSEQGFM